MNSIILGLLTVNPAKVGVYSLLDYIGKHNKDNTILRLTTVTIGTIISLIYFLLFSYVLYDLKKEKSDNYFVRRVPNIVSLIFSILVLGIFLFIYYKNYYNNNKLNEIEKIVLLAYVITLFSLIFVFLGSYMKLRHNHAYQEVFIGWQFYLMYLSSILVLIVRSYKIYLMEFKKLLL